MAQNETTSRSAQSRFRAMLELVRLPNLFTVPGDPIAGFLLACTAAGGDAEWWRAIPAALCGLLLYCTGLIQNDLVDLKADLAARPHRPLPSGRISLRFTLAALFVFLLGGMTSAAFAGGEAFLVAACLLVAVFAYNHLTKRIAVIGPVNMGLCRGLSLLVGAAAAGGWGILSAWPVILSAGFLTAYVAIVTHIASRETTQTRFAVARFLPALVVIVWLAYLQYALLISGSPDPVGMLAGGAVAVAWLAYCAVLLRGSPQPATIQKAVGRFLQGLLLIQAAVAASTGPAGWVVAAVLVAMLPAAVGLSRRFYAS